uniref:Histone-lysine N-methyltransferase n=1 Tax=Megaselia scalaris TaxID=36166 RepID=T1GRQ2_MEGSC
MSPPRKKKKRSIVKSHEKYRDIDEVIDDILNLGTDYLFEDIESSNCTSEDHFNSENSKLCFVCRKPDSIEVTAKCLSSKCGRYFHHSCLKLWPQSIWHSGGKIINFVCPSHICHTCVSDEPIGQTILNCKTKFAKCRICPGTYHKSSYCIPAGSQILDDETIVCPKHDSPLRHINVDWCFICVKSGKLLHCEMCPASVHSFCTINPENPYICDDCESGRFPLYGELVWAKFSNYKWWPSIILPPTEVPLNIRELKHSTSEFVIKKNKLVFPVKISNLYNENKIFNCNCRKDSENPCGRNSECLNRLLFIECDPKKCPAEEKCENQLFQKKLYAKMKVKNFGQKGFGLIAMENIASGTFVIEFVGEIIDLLEYKRRLAIQGSEKNFDYYFMTLENQYYIDASRKGNIARFIEHSCDPNCETQKWFVNGTTRIGIFAIKDILKDQELTYNYRLQCTGPKRKCLCKSSNCIGFIGDD